ncbi:MAG TPA: hypothetical protein VJ483_01050, partial [Holophagaceae bacterium]|nr:hypothetical protein [Holophagaceae bacterium]
LNLQDQAPTREAADALAARAMRARLASADANDMLYQLDASRFYDPRPGLAAIRCPVLAINTADDLINPPELGIFERETRKVPKGRALLIPISAATRGHGSHTVASLWKDELARLLRESGPER